MKAKMTLILNNKFIELFKEQYKFMSDRETLAALKIYLTNIFALYAEQLNPDEPSIEQVVCEFTE